MPQARIIVHNQFASNLQYNPSMNSSSGTSGRNILRYLNNEQLLRTDGNFRREWNQHNQSTNRLSSNINVTQYVNSGVIQQNRVNNDTLTREQLLERLQR